MEKQKETVLTWLNNAHAIELTLAKNLKEKSKDAETAGKTEIKEKMDELMEGAERHTKLVETCIARFAGGGSVMKDVMGKAIGLMQGSMNSMFEDTMVKNVLETYAGAQLEIGAFSVLAAAAKEIGDTEMGDICTEILEDAEEAADWALDQIDATTIEHLNEVKNK